MSKLDELNGLWQQLLNRRKIPGQVGTIGRPSDLIPEYAGGKLRGYWKNVKHKQ